MAAAEAEAIETAPEVDLDTITAHFEMLHQLAAPLAVSGKLITASFGADPDGVDPKTRKPGRAIAPKVPHFDIGDAATAARNAAMLSAQEHRNVYAPVAIYSKRLPAGAKGSEEDIIGQIGIVADFDDEDAANWPDRLPLPPQYVLETSAGRFQAFYLFDQIYHPERAKPIAERLANFAGCDHGTKDLSHVWRVPGALNWPNAKKVHEGGRSREPQLVRVVVPWDGSRIKLDDLDAALPAVKEEPKSRVSASAEEGGSADDEAPIADVSIDLLVKLLPTRLYKEITEPGTGDRSKALFKVVKRLAEREINPGQIERIINAHPRGIGAKYVDRSDLRKEIDRILSKPSRPAATAGTGKPIIYCVAGQLPRIVDEAEEHLIAADPRIYQRGDFIVRPAPVAAMASDKREITALRLVPIKLWHLIERLGRVIDFQKFDGRTEDWVSTDCPQAVANAYLERTGAWRVPILAGVTNCPTLRSDGSLIDQPGYDTATGILYDPCGAEYPPIPIAPTKQDARAALDILISLIAEFPFVGADGSASNAVAVGVTSPSRSVALSAILTTMIRRSIPRAPLHGFTAPVRGSGKSKLVDIASMIFSGHEAPVKSQGKSEEEMEKRLGAALIAGDALISFDNCEQPLGGELLCQALTQSTLSIRILGKSVNVTLPSNATFFATGNNLVVIGDMTRRTLVATLDPKTERPETREFEGDDPVEVVRRDRAPYVVAALTVLRAYFEAGRPEQGTKPLGSFEVWSRTVRDALIWLGEPDPCDTMERIQSEDPQTQALGEVLHQWWEANQERGVTVKRAIEVAGEKVQPEKDAYLRAADEVAGSNRFPEPVFKYPEFRDALLTVAEDRGSISSRRLVQWLSNNKGRIVGGLRLDPGLGTSHGGAMRWKVSKV